MAGEESRKRESREPSNGTERSRRIRERGGTLRHVQQAPLTSGLVVRGVGARCPVSRAVSVTPLDAPVGLTRGASRWQSQCETLNARGCDA